MHAWGALRDDRHYGAFGGLSGIHYQAIAQYARDNAIQGEAFNIFVAIIRGMDAEYIAHVIEKQKPKKK